MKKLIQTLAEKLNLSESSIYEALNLTPEAKNKDYLEALGVYAIFENKNDIEEYLNTKIANKTKKISDLEIELNNKVLEFENQKNEFETLKTELETKQNNLKNVIKNAWKNAGIKRDFEKVNLDYSNLDFSNLSKSILEFAEAEGFAIEKSQLIEKENNNTNFKNNNISISADGVVTKI